jgi:hypothetical protein
MQERLTCVEVEDAFDGGDSVNNLRSLRPFSALMVSSESIQKIQSPVACCNDSFRAAEKSSHQGK